MPIIDCIVKTSATIKSAATFMLSFIPIFSAAMVSAGQPITGSTYSIFLMGICQLVAQVVSQTLIPLMAVYLAVSICGSFVPDLNIASAINGLKTGVNWAMGFMLTVFVALLSIQSMLSHSADGVTVKATKFLITSLVPVAGNVLSEAFIAAQGSLRLLKTTVGAYGIMVSLLTFLPVFLQVAIWRAIAGIISVAGDVMGLKRVSAILKGCAFVLGMLMSALLCFAFLMIVSTSVVMAIGMGG
jgi:stage III sporulation protein AE